MSFQMKMKHFKNFFDHYKACDVSVDVSETDSLYLGYIGTVKVKTPTKTLEYEIFHSENVDTCSAIRTTSEDFIIVFSTDFLNNECVIHNVATVLKGIIAHELGHLINGDLEAGSDNLGWLTINKETQIRLFEIARTTGMAKDEDRYYRCVLSSMMRGGCLEKELNADLTALRFVPLEDIVYIHSLSFEKIKDNPYTTLEKVNRIRFLNAFNKSMLATNEDIEAYTEGYSMEVYFNTRELKPWHEVIDTIIDTDTRDGSELLDLFQEEFNCMISDKPIDGWLPAREGMSGYRHPDYYDLAYKFANKHHIKTHKQRLLI